MPWHLLPVKHGRTSPPTPFSGLSAPVSPLFLTCGPARFEIPLADALMSAFAMFSLKDPSLLGLRPPPPQPQGQLPHHLWDQPRPLRLSDAGHPAILSIPRTCGPRSARSSVACNAARCSNASSISDGHYLLSLDGTTYLLLLQDPLFLLSGKAPIATAASPIPINCWGHPRPSRPQGSHPAGTRADHPAGRSSQERLRAERHPPLARTVSPGASHLPVIVVEDALSATPAPSRPASRLAPHYIIGVKPGDHAFCSTTCGPSTRPARCRSLPWRIQRRALCIISGSAMACRCNESNPTSWSMCWNTGRSTPMERCSISVGSPTFS